MFWKKGKITVDKKFPFKLRETKILLGFYFLQMVKYSIYFLLAEAWDPGTYFSSPPFFITLLSANKLK